MPVLVLVLLAVGLAACGDEENGATGSTLASEVRYVRSGGFAGGNDELTIRPDGRGTLASRRRGGSAFIVDEDERAGLADALSGFGDVPAESRAAKPAPDAFVHSITYDGRTVVADDPSMPATLKPAIGELSRILEARLR